MNKRSAERAAVKLRGRVWIERRGAALLTEAGADLLEQIQACGSLSEAARRLGFSYRRAWMLVDGMNRRWRAPVVVKATGGRRGGGSKLTELGVTLLSVYRNFQVEIEALLDQQQRQLHVLLRLLLD